MIEIVILISGSVAGGLVAWFWASSRAHAHAAHERVDLHAQVASGTSTISELRRQLTERGDSIEELRRDLRTQEQARITAQTQFTESLKNIEEQRKLLEEAEKKLKDTFTALSADALRSSNETFAQQTIERMKPLHDVLERYETQIKELEKTRRTDYGALGEQLQSLRVTHQQLAHQTTTLVGALRTPEVKGRWGELQLRRTVEVAGMSAHCDFIEKPSVNTEEGRRQPDLIIKLPGNRTVVVDSKVSTNAYLDAVGAEDEEARRRHLTRYVQGVRKHMADLSKKEYWNQFDTAPDFVVMYVPGESFFSAALEQNRHLIEEGLAERVLLASPTTFIAMLRAMAHGWQQQQLIENAREIGDTAKQLYERVGKFVEHLGKVGDGLRRSIEAYNAAASSWESRVVPVGRRVTELGVAAKDGSFPELKRVDVAPRELPGERCPVPGEQSTDKAGPR